MRNDTAAAPSGTPHVPNVHTPVAPNTGFFKYRSESVTDGIG
jgi:hypothetical protein